jgi:glycine oxidase
VSAVTPGLRVVVVGGGVIGLACADELVRAGHDVTVCDPRPACGSTYAAAGMLAPGGEAWFGEEALLRLGIDSLERWPAFAASLEERSGHHLDLRSTGTMLVAADRDDLAEVHRACQLLNASGVRVEELDRRTLRAAEPALSGRVVGGALLPDDRHVNPRRVTDALLAVLGDRVVRARATPGSDGVVLDDGSHLRADVVVLATGATGMPHVRPVRGEVVRVRCTQAPTRVLRARLHGERVYVVPRAHGELLIGATEEEHPAGDGDPLPTLGGVVRLLVTARALVPGLATAELLEVVARDRPGSPDNGPLLGPVSGTGSARMLLAGGHHRGGVLLAPVTAATVRAHVDGLGVPPAAQAFDPHRFDSHTDTDTDTDTDRNEEPCA